MRGDQPVVRAASLMVNPSIGSQPYHDLVKVRTASDFFRAWDSSPLGHLSKYDLKAGVGLSMVTNLESGSRRPGMERSRKRTPIQRTKGACRIGLVRAFGSAIFAVGGAAAGDGTYPRHVREH